jgi:hypothetical protein
MSRQKSYIPQELQDRGFILEKCWSGLGGSLMLGELDLSVLDSGEGTIRVMVSDGPENMTIIAEHPEFSALLPVIDAIITAPRKP